MFDVKVVTSRPGTPECGAACLTALLDYYGVEANLEDITRECNIQVEGIYDRAILQVGRNHGLDMRAYKMDAESLLTTDRPVIILWKYFHYCVFCGMNDEGKTVIMNPNRGRFSIGKEELTAFFNERAWVNGIPEDIEPDTEKQEEVE